MLFRGIALFIDSLTSLSPLSLPINLGESYVAGALHPKSPVLTLHDGTPREVVHPHPQPLTLALLN